MNNRRLAVNARAVTSTAGRYALKGIKLAGRGVLSATELAGKGVNSVAKNRKGRKLLSKAAIIAACVAMPSIAATFATAGITTTALHYMCKNVLLGKDTSPLQAAEEVLHLGDNVLDKALAAVSLPVRAIGKGVETISKAGKNALER